MAARPLRIATAAAALSLGACGGGSGDGRVSYTLVASDSAGRSIDAPHAHPAPRAEDVALAPVLDQSGILGIGTDIFAAAFLHTALLAPVADRPGASWGRVRDGVGGAYVRGYLEQILWDTDWYVDNNLRTQRATGGDPERYPGLFRFLSAPTVHIETGASDTHVETVLRGVHIVNEALPPRWHIRIGPDAPAFTGDDPDISEGQIHVFFAPRETWPFFYKDPDTYKDSAGAGGGGIHWRDDSEAGLWGHIWMNTGQSYDEHQMLYIFVHELLHALGFFAHVTDIESTLNVDWDGSREGPIFPADAEALRAAYTRLDFGDDADAIHAGLADWSSTSTYLVGKAGSTVFGAAHRNGFVRPWAGGPGPRTDLADSLLSGDVEWNGALLGFTPGGAAVAGDAAIGVDLATLLGTASFESLESWTAGNPPGAPGTGATWGDGDLGYGIAVDGNTFRRTGGDDGVLTGIFVGEGHDGAAGTLERDDLTAGFGTVRGSDAARAVDTAYTAGSPVHAIYVPPTLPAPRAQDVALAPVVEEFGALRVGTGIFTAAFLDPVVDRPATSWGRLRDGVGSAEVARYLNQTLWDTQWYADNNVYTQRATGTEPETYPGLFRFFSAPTVHIEEGTQTPHVETVLRAVQIINEALPPDLHLEIGADAPAFAGTEPAVPGGQIHAFFVPRAEWPLSREDPELYKNNHGISQLSYLWRDDGSQAPYGRIWIHPDEPLHDAMVDTVVRQLLHALGLWNHDMDLQPLSEEALRAAYMRLEWGSSARDIHRELGDWADTSTRLAGRAGAAAFGAAHRNGFVRPWAGGASPRTNLAASPLGGNVAWHGELLGFTPAGAPVAGDAAIGVDLSTLGGTASFESLETWTAGTPPGAPGTGVMWGDGDLDYAIAVRGNTFHRTGGDDGALTGIFVGADHQGAAGTLERDDLSAGFGATRQSPTTDLLIHHFPQGGSDGPAP